MPKIVITEAFDWDGDERLNVFVEIDDEEFQLNSLEVWELLFNDEDFDGGVVPDERLDALNEELASAGHLRAELIRLMAEEA